MKDGVGVAVAVEVEVDVGVGVPVTVGVGVGGFGAGVGDTGAEDVADGDGFALVGEAEGGATGGALMTAGALVAGERLGIPRRPVPCSRSPRRWRYPTGCLTGRRRPGAGCASR